MYRFQIFYWYGYAETYITNAVANFGLLMLSTSEAA